MKDAFYMLLALVVIGAATLLFWRLCPPIADFTSLPSEHHPFTETSSHD